MIGKLIPFGYAAKDAIEHLDQLMGPNSRVADQNMRLFDIRWSPRSRLPQWRRETLEAKWGTRYQHIPDLGNVAYKNKATEPIKLANPDEGIPYLVSYLEAGYDVVLLCACKQYETCHRKVVVELVRQVLPEVEAQSCRQTPIE